MSQVYWHRGEFPDDPLAGFLPPNINPPEGDGSVLFTVMPRENLPTGTEIRNSANIVFDVNEPIDTPEWFNTLDNDNPQSQVQPLAPTQSSESFEVTWSGDDIGAGIKDFTIFVSEDGGPFTPFATNTPETSTIFTGQADKTYEFFSAARDQTGNVEEIRSVADTSTTVSPGPALILVPNVVGQSQADAETAITAAGLVVGELTTQNSDTVPEGNVIDQSPEAGTGVESGSQVALVVSAGPVVAEKTLCSNLGNNDKRFVPDVDVFKLVGTKGEQVTVTLDKDPTGSHKGETATLILIRGVSLFKINDGSLPTNISVTLPATGAYRAIVNEQLRLFQKKRFKGDYCLTLRSSAGASQTLAPSSSVE